MKNGDINAVSPDPVKRVDDVPDGETPPPEKKSLVASIFANRATSEPMDSMAAPVQDLRVKGM